MALDKKSVRSDQIANLYRSAYYMATGSTITALELLKKSPFYPSGMKLNTKKDRLFWAEKILDEYTRLSISS